MTKKFTKLISIALILVLLVGATVLPVGAADITNADIIFTPGLLELTKAPSFQFGSQSISAAAKVYTGNVVDSIIVSDARGSDAGWKITVALSDFNDSTSTASLLSSDLIFTNSAYTGGAVDPTTYPATVTLISGGASSPVVTAALGEGSGLVSSTPSAVTLKVQQSQGKLGAHNAKLNWTLANTP